MWQMGKYIMINLQEKMEHILLLPELHTHVMMDLLKRIMAMVSVIHGGTGIGLVSHVLVDKLIIPIFKCFYCPIYLII